MKTLIFQQGKINQEKRRIYFNPLAIAAGLLMTTTVFGQSDTLMFNTVSNVYVNPTDAPMFAVQTEDLDGLTPHAMIGVGTAFDPKMSTIPSDIFPGDVGTATYYAATSYFDPAECCADNWLEFGPITIPAEGATMEWDYRAAQEMNQDGYSIYTSTTGMSNYTDFTGPAVFVKADNMYAGDTSWYHKQMTFDGATFGGQQIYIAFHHTSSSLFALYVDNLLITKGAVNGISESADATLTVKQNYPNPTSGSTTINYTLEATTPVVFVLTDLAGKVIEQNNLGTQLAGAHQLNVDATELSAGTYFYSLTVGGAERIVRKMTVIK